MINYKEARDRAIRIIQQILINKKKSFTKSDLSKFCHLHPIVLSQISDILINEGFCQLFNTEDFEITSQGIHMALINRAKFIPF